MPDGVGRVGILVKEKWVEHIVDVNQVNDKVIVIKVLVSSTVISVVFVYAPQCGLDENTKNKLYDNL